MVVGRESQYICPFRYLLGLHIRKVSKNVVTSVLALSPLGSKATPTLVSLRDLILIFRRASLSLSAMDPGLQIRGEPVHPDREIRGGPSLKKMPQSGMKIMGGGPPGPLPWIHHGLLYGSPPPPPSGKEPARRKLQRRQKSMAQKSREIYKAVSVYWKLKLTRNVEIISWPPCACMTHNSSTYLRCYQLFHNVNNSKQQDPAVLWRLLYHLLTRALCKYASRFLVLLL